MDFVELNIDGLIDTGSLSGAIPEADSRKIRLLAPHTILNEGPPHLGPNLWLPMDSQKHLLKQ